MHRTLTKEIANHLRVDVWSDPVVEAVGHDPRSTYVHEFWLPIVGPSALLVARKMLERLEAAGGPCTIELDELALSVGLGRAVGRNSRITTTLGRLAGFGLVHLANGGDASTTVVVRTAWAPLTRAQALKLPPSLVERLAAA